MTMQHLENELRRTGDPGKQAFADVIADIHKSLGSDIPLPSVATPVVSQSAKAESQLIFPSLDKLVVVTDAPEIAKAWEKKGITNFDFFRLSAHEFKRDGDYPGWNVKPEAWFWEGVASGKISPDATKLEDVLIAIDNTPKPNYNNGRQLYEKDPFGPLLERLRKEKKINVPRDLRHIPPTSRFGIFPNELASHVLPEIAKMLGVDSNKVRLPKEGEFNVIGNLFRKEWGTTNTWEWMQDKSGGGGRLVGGNSDRGGLAFVYYFWSDVHYDFIGFRPLVVLSPKA